MATAQNVLNGDGEDQPGPSLNGSSRQTYVMRRSDSRTHLPDYYEIVPTLRSNIEQMRKCISIDLLSATQREANFLRIIDRKAAMLYEPTIVENAIRRYECFWLPMQVLFLLTSNKTGSLMFEEAEGNFCHV